VGHIRLGQLPRSRKWRDVVELVAAGADVPLVARKILVMPDLIGHPEGNEKRYLETWIRYRGSSLRFVSHVRGNDTVAELGVKGRTDCR